MGVAFPQGKSWVHLIFLFTQKEESFDESFPCACLGGFQSSKTVYREDFSGQISPSHCLTSASCDQK